MAGWFWRVAAATPLLGWASALATPLPEEWPGEWPGLPPRPAPQEAVRPAALPDPALRPNRPELVPAAVAVGDLTPPRLAQAAAGASRRDLAPSPAASGP